MVIQVGVLDFTSTEQPRILARRGILSTCPIGIKVQHLLTIIVTENNSIISKKKLDD